MRGRWLLLVFVATVQAGWVGLGPIVRATDSALACPDWPLCEGRLLPLLDAQLAAEPEIWLEWSHRMLELTMLAGLAALAIADRVGGGRRRSVARESRGGGVEPAGGESPAHGAGDLAWICLGAIALGQIAFDGARVATHLAPWTVAARDGLGLVLLAALVWIARDHSDARSERARSSSVRAGTALASSDAAVASSENAVASSDPALAISGTSVASSDGATGSGRIGRSGRAGSVGAGAMVVGGVVAALFAASLWGGLFVSLFRAGLACAEFPTCRAGVFVPTFDGAIGIHVMHRILAVLFTAGLVAWIALVRAWPRIASPLWWALRIALFALATGWMLVELRLPLAARAVHAGLASAIGVAISLAIREMLYHRTSKWT